MTHHPGRIEIPARLRPTPIALIVHALLLGTPATATLGAAVWAPPALAQAEVAKRFDVPAGSLDDALNTLARQAGITLSFDPALVADGITSPGLKGSYAVQDGFTALLAGTGLEAFQQADRSYGLRVLADRKAEVTLPTIKVTNRANTPLPSSQERGYRIRSSSVSGFREQDVLNTPFSIATMSAELIEDQQAKSLIDVLKNDPSATPAADPLWFDRVNVRGFNLSVNAIYRDGLSINDQGSIALENKAAVEINKGLSALRYGATSPGGTLNYVVKRPTAEPLRKVSVNADSNGGYGVHTDLGDRFGETKQFGYRLNVAATELRSHVDAFKGEKQFISGFFDWEVSDALSLELDVEHQELDKLSVRTPQLWWFGTTDAARAAFPRLRPDTYSHQSWAMEPNRQTYVAARANYQFSDDWKATLAVQNSKLKRDQNSSGVWDTVAVNGEYEADIYYSPNQERNNRAYHLVIQGDVRMGQMRHELAFGHDQVQRDMTWPEGVYEPIGFDNIFRDRNVPRPNVGQADAGPSFLANRSRQRSWFLTDNLMISDQWHVFGGLRHTSIQQFGAGSATAALTKRYDKSAVNPTVGLIYKPVATGTLYISYAEGIEQGGIVNGANYTNNGAQLSPLESRQYEAGVKWEVGHDAIVTGALFEINKGLEIDRNNGNGTRTRVQDGRQVHRGIELTASGQVTPQLKLIAGLAYLDATIEKTSNASLVGKKPQGVPDRQANLYADYSLNQWMQGLSINGGLYYGGRKAIDTINTWMADRYVRLDAGVKYTQKMSGGQQAIYRLNVDNLTDKRYLANTTSGSLQFGEPRTVRVSASYSF